MRNAANTSRHRAVALRIIAVAAAAVALLTPAIAAGDGGSSTPPAPSGVAVVGASTSSISISWNASANAVGYRVSRDGHWAGYTGRTTFTISGLECGRTYQLGVTALGWTARSAESRVTGSTAACAASGDTSSGGSTSGGSTSGGSTSGGSTSGGSTSGGSTLAFGATADAHVSERAPSSNFGGDATLRAEGGSDPDSEAFLRFVVGSLPGSVQKAKLRLNVTDSSSDGPGVYTVSGSWSESSVTFANHPPHAGSALADVGSLSTGWVEYDVSSLVKGSGTYNLVVATGSSDGASFSSRETSSAPQLVLTVSSTGGGSGSGSGSGTSGGTGGSGGTSGSGGSTSDTQAPTVPASLDVTGTTTSSIAVSWPASTDNVGVTAYGVYVNGTLVQTTTTRSYTASNLACGTGVTLAVDAADAAGNRSAKRSITASTAACSQPPPTTTPTSACTKVASPGAGTAQALLASLSSGQVGCLRGGTYTASGMYVLDFTKPNVVLQSYPGERALLRGLVVIRSGAAGSRMSKLSFEGTGGANSIQWYATDFTLEDSDITNKNRGYSCMILGDSSAGVAVRPVIRRNVFHECGRVGSSLEHGIYAQLTTDGRITDNVFWGIAAYSLHLYPNAQRTVFSHNVIDGGSPSVRGGVIFAGEGSQTSNNNVVEYNVIAYSTAYNIESWWGGSTGSGNVARSNCVFGAGKANIGSTSGYTVTGTVTADPLFVNRSARDYRLQSSSPCLGTVGYDTAARLG
jgi:chitodextrinase